MLRIVVTANLLRSWATLTLAAAALLHAGAGRGAFDPDDTLQLTLTASLLRDSNLFRLPDGDTRRFGIDPANKSDTITSPGVALKIDKTVSRQRFIVDANVQQNTYSNNSRFDHISGKGAARWLWEVGNQWDGELRYEYQQRLTGFADLRASIKNLVDSNTVWMSGGYKLDPRWRVWGALSYFETQNSAITQVQNDTQVDGFVIGADYRTPADNSIGLQVKRLEGLFPHREIAALQLIDNQYTETTPALAWVWNYSGQTRFDGKLGYTVREHQQFSARDFKGPTGQLHYTGLPTGKLRFDVNAWRELWTAESQTSSYVIASGIRVTPSWALTQKVTLRGNFSYETRVYQGDPGVALGITSLREDTLRTLQLAAIYAPLRSVELQLLLERGARDSNQPINQYEYNSALLYLQVKF